MISQSAWGQIQRHLILGAATIGLAAGLSACGHTAANQDDARPSEQILIDTTGGPAHCTATQADTQKHHHNQAITTPQTISVQHGGGAIHVTCHRVGAQSVSAVITDQTSTVDSNGTDAKFPDCHFPAHVIIPMGEGATPTKTAAVIAKTTAAAAPSGHGTFKVYFVFDSAALDDAADQVIATAVASTLRGPTKILLVSGHADSVGNAAYNLDLAGKRARNVADALIAKGVNKSAISVQNMGENQPAVATGDDVKEAANRRVEIIVRPVAD